MHVGKNVVVNFNCNFVDDGEIFIGDYCMIGPNCNIITANHPISPRLRKAGLQFNKPVRLENNVWLGTGVTVLSGVTIGENSIIGAGSVVTKGIEPNSIAVGNPARVIKYLDRDKFKKE